MNREEYLSELYGRLRQGLPAGELEHIMKYYEEYFDEAGPQREQEVLSELGSPADLSREIMASRGNLQAEPPRYEEARRGKRHWTAGKIVALVLLSPLWITLICAIPATAIALVVGLSGGGLALIAGGIFNAWCGFTALFTPGIPTTLFFCGVGLVFAGLGVLLVLAGVALGKVLFKGLFTLCRWLFVGRKAVTA